MRLVVLITTQADVISQWSAVTLSTIEIAQFIYLAPAMVIARKPCKKTTVGSADVYMLYTICYIRKVGDICKSVWYNR
jgi:hypothetical protein